MYGAGDNLLNNKQPIGPLAQWYAFDSRNGKIEGHSYISRIACACVYVYA